MLSILIGSGGTLGIAKTIRLLKPREATEKPIRNGERAAILQTLARFEQYFIETAGTLARIEGNARSSEKYMTRRLNELEDRVTRLEDKG